MAGLGSEYEKIVVAIAKIILGPSVWVERERPLTELVREPLGSESLRADVFITGLLSFPDGLAISVKSQNSSGSAIEKIPYHVDHQIPCYPCPILLLMLGDIWGTRQGREFFDYARSRRDGVHFLDVFSSLDDFVRWCMGVVAKDENKRTQYGLWDSARMSSDT